MAGAGVRAAWQAWGRGRGGVEGCGGAKGGIWSVVLQGRTAVPFIGPLRAPCGTML